MTGPFGYRSQDMLGKCPERIVLGFLKGPEDKRAGATAAPVRVSFKVNTATAENATSQDLSTLELKMG